MEGLGFEPWPPEEEKKNYNTYIVETYLTSSFGLIYINKKRCFYFNKRKWDIFNSKVNHSAQDVQRQKHCKIVTKSPVPNTQAPPNKRKRDEIVKLRHPYIREGVTTNHNKLKQKIACEPLTLKKTTTLLCPKW